MPAAIAPAWVSCEVEGNEGQGRTRPGGSFGTQCRCSLSLGPGRGAGTPQCRCRGRPPGPYWPAHKSSLAACHDPQAASQVQSSPSFYPPPRDGPWGCAAGYTPGMGCGGQGRGSVRPSGTREALGGLLAGCYSDYYSCRRVCPESVQYSMLKKASSTSAACAQSQCVCFLVAREGGSGRPLGAGTAGNSFTLCATA